MLFSGDVLQHKVVVLKPLELAHFSSVQIVGFLVVEQILVIGLHYYLVLGSCKVQSPMRQGFNYHEQFFCVDIPVALAAVHCL